MGFIICIRTECYWGLTVKREGTTVVVVFCAFIVRLIDSLAWKFQLIDFPI